MSTDVKAAVLARLEVLRKAGKVTEAEKLLAGVLAELEKVPTNPTFKVDLGGGIFKRDFSKEGYDLVSDVGPLSGEVEFEAVPVLKDGESAVGGDEMVKRAVKLYANLGQRDGENEKLLANIPKELRSFYIILPGTIWVSRDARRCFVPCLHWSGKRWVVSLDCLVDGYGSLGRLLVPRKST